MARELGGREAIAAALKNLPEGFSVAANEVKAPPYIFQAYKDPVAVTLTLTGIRARQQRPCRAGGGGGAQVLQRKGRRQPQGERRRARRALPTRWCLRSARCRGCRPARSSSPTGRSSCRAMRFMKPPPVRSAPASARTFRRAGSSSRKSRSSRPRRRWMRRSASNYSPICSARPGSGSNPARPTSSRIPPACSTA